MVVIDATNLILGRLASYAAKKALLGENVDIINCENAVITGSRERTIADHKRRIHRGSIRTGPFPRRRPDMFVKRTIRGMLPYNKEIGKKALKRIKCYIGVPTQLKDKKPEHLIGMDLSKLTVMKYTTVKDVCKMIGGKV